MFTIEKIMESLSEQILRVKSELKKDETRFVETNVVSVVTSGNIVEYKVKIDGYDYVTKNGTNITFVVGDGVIVCIPNNDYKRKFIIAKR